MVKLIVSDMDGTLLDSNHELSNEFWTVFKELKKRNILFSVASGRQYQNLLEIFKTIRKDMLFVAENGALVVKDGKELLIDILENEIVEECIKLSRENLGINIVLCGKKTAYIETIQSDFIKEVSKYYSKYKLVDNLNNVKEKILKIALYNQNDVEKECLPHLVKYRDNFNIISSSKYWIDIMNKSTNKGNAVSIIQELYNIDNSEIMAFGDYLNDLEMLENCKYSYAMENAHPKIKEISNYITGSNNDNSVIKVIKKYLQDN